MWLRPTYGMHTLFMKSGCSRATSRDQQQKLEDNEQRPGKCSLCSLVPVRRYVDEMLRDNRRAHQCRRTALTSPDVDAQGLLDGLPCFAESMGEVGVAGAEPLPDSPLFKRAFTSDLASRSRSAALENRPVAEHSCEWSR